jgi:hypothetical protein
MMTLEETALVLTAKDESMQKIEFHTAKVLE